jgi:flagella basal body P-ring formation protein FlgA
MIRLLLAILTSILRAQAGCIAVDGEFIRVADVPPHIAGNSLAGDEILFRAPVPGVRRIVEGSELRRALRLPEGSPPLPAVCFEQATETLNEERIVAAMRNAFSGLEVSIRVADYSLYPVPKGRLEFSRNGLMATPSTKPGQRVMWRGRVVAAAGRSVPVWARVYLECRREVLAAKRSIEAGERIQPEDLVIERRAVFPFADQSALRMEEAAGLAARRRIAAGSEVTRQLLVEPFAVEPRQSLDLLVNADGIRLKMPAVAEGRARAGEYVWVKQTVTGRRLRGLVTGHREVVLHIDEPKGEARHEMDGMHTGGAIGVGRR